MHRTLVAILIACAFALSGTALPANINLNDEATTIDNQVTGNDQGRAFTRTEADNFAHLLVIAIDEADDKGNILLQNAVVAANYRDYPQATIKEWGEDSGLAYFFGSDAKYRNGEASARSPNDNSALVLSDRSRRSDGKSSTLRTDPTADYIMAVAAHQGGALTRTATLSLAGRSKVSRQDMNLL